MTKSIKSRSEKRKANKPLMEKKRRARINDSLTILKNLILEDSQSIEQKIGSKSVTAQSRLEKADVLELAVLRMRQLQKQNRLGELVKSAPFRAGYEACLREIQTIVSASQNLPEDLMDRLKNRLISSSQIDSLEATSESLLNSSGDSGKLSHHVKVSPTRLADGRLALVFSQDICISTQDSTAGKTDDASNSVWRPW